MARDWDVQLNEMRQELEQERRLRKQADSRAEQAENQTRRTTFEELLESCHRLSQSISVQTDKVPQYPKIYDRSEGQMLPDKSPALARIP